MLEQTYNRDLFIEISTRRDLIVSASGFEHDILAFIFLLLNHLSHNTQFSTRQNKETFQLPQKNSNFYLHRFSWYSTPNMAFQKIILTSFFFFFFFPIEGYAFSIT